VLGNTDSAPFSTRLHKTPIFRITIYAHEGGLGPIKGAKMTQVVVCGGGEGGAGRGAGVGRPAALSVGQLVSLCTALSFLPWRLLLLFGDWILLSCARIFLLLLFINSP
jgi:hypothetical protein